PRQRATRPARAFASSPPRGSGGSDAGGGGSRTSRVLPDDRSCGQSGDDPVWQVHEQQVNGEERPALLQAKKTRAPHWQEDQEEGQHRREEVEKTEEVQPRP